MKLDLKTILKWVPIRIWIMLACLIWTKASINPYEASAFEISLIVVLGAGIAREFVKHLYNMKDEDNEH